MVRIPLPRLAVPLASLLISAEAAGQTPAPPPAAQDAPKPAAEKPAAAAPRPAPPTGKAQPKKAAAGRKKKGKADPAPPITGAVATSPAFRMLEDGKSRVFLEVNQKVEVTEQKARGRVVYRLKGASVPVRNSRLPLPTGFFPTPVGLVELAQQDDGAALVIELREPAEPTHRLIETPRGIALQVDFPAISAASGNQPSASPMPPRSSKQIPAAPDPDASHRGE